MKTKIKKCNISLNCSKENKTLRHKKISKKTKKKKKPPQKQEKPHHIQNLYCKTYKMSTKEIKDDLNSWRVIPWSWTGRLNTKGINSS